MYEGAATHWYVHHYVLVASMKTQLHTGRIFNAQLHNGSNYQRQTQLHVVNMHEE